MSLVANSLYIFESNNWVSEADLLELRAHPLPPMSVVFGKIGEGLKRNRFRVLTRPTLIDNNMMGAIPNSLVDQRFFAIVMSQIDMGSLAEGSALPYLRAEDVGNVRVLLPPLDEQRAIAGVLGALDDKIEANRRIVKQLELLLLAHSISLSTLPTVALRDVSKSYRRPVNPLVLGDEWVDHFSLPAFDAAAMPERCQASSIMSGKFGIETTSVLISRLNPGTPRVWCAHVREVPAMCSSEFLVLEPLKKSSVGALWLAAVHPSLGEQMVQRATGTSFSHQRIKSDDALSVEVPDIRMIDEQTRGECDELVKMVGKRRGETEHLSRLRDVLLPELLSGRLLVKVAESMMENV
jgi:type I restriction enzyme S subunit